MTYECDWSEDNQQVVIYKAVSDNRFALGPKLTEEERQAARDKRNSQTPFENLRDLMIEHQAAKWMASPLYVWFENNCPGYRRKVGPEKESIEITFADSKHAMMFKLTWCGK